MKNKNATTNVVNNTNELDTLRKKFGVKESLAIKPIIRHRDYGIQKGALIKFRYPGTTSSAYYHNVYKEVDIEGKFERENKFKGFFLCVYLGEKDGCPVHDELRFYDQENPMTFEECLAEIKRVHEWNLSNPSDIIEPKGMAKKLLLIATENGFNHPLDMFDSGVEIEYAQVAQKYGFKGNTRRVVVSAKHWRRNPSSDQKVTSFANKAGQANRNAFAYIR